MANYNGLTKEQWESARKLRIMSIKQLCKLLDRKPPAGLESFTDKHIVTTDNSLAKECAGKGIIHPVIINGIKYGRK